MGKTSLCIQMLQLLSSGRMYKISELAELLETKDRNIIEYKKELEECGYYIISNPSRNGGYRLDQSCIFPSLKLNNEEKEALMAGFNYLNARNDFVLKKEYQKATSKIFSSINSEQNDNDVLVINRYPLAMSEEDLKYRYTLLSESIVTRNVVRFSYVSQKNKEHEYLFHPYDLFMYNNAWFVIGWNEYFNDVLYFKLNRITKIEKLSKTFKVLRGYNKKDYIDDSGFKKNGDWYHIEFKAYGKYASLVKERVYGKNQEVIPLDENTTLVKVDMQNQENILVFILGFNKYAEVIEPQWLKDKLIESADFIKNKYKK